MAKKRSTNRNQNYADDASSSKKKVNTGDNGGAGPWSDFNHHVLFLIMMQLGVVEYISFGGVCKSWRSLAVSNRNTFMASKPPMSMRICWRGSKKACYIEDFEGRKFKTILPHFVGGVYVGLTCEYLIFFNRTSRKFWLVNPITRHELHFTDFPINDHFFTQSIKAILVFSISVFGWVFIVTQNSNCIWFSIAGTWNHLPCTSVVADLSVFKGKIYTLHRNPTKCLYELRLNSQPKLTLLETKNSLKPFETSQLASSSENIYVMYRIWSRVQPRVNIYSRTPKDLYRFQELDLCEMKWVLREKALGEYTSFLSNLKRGVTNTRVSGDSPGRSLLVGHNTGEMLKLIELEKPSSFSANLWYFPHECMNVDLIDD